MTDREAAKPGTTASDDDKAAGQRAAIALGATVLLTALAALVLGTYAYPWIKSVHVIAIISWMAGLLYLPRLFVYHADAPAGSDLAKTLTVMEYRLLTYIMSPAMIIAWLLGLSLAYMGSFWTSGWFIAKLVFVIGLSAAHGYLTKAQRAFAAGQNTQTARHWRLINEIPTLLMIAIVILVIVKPF